MKTSLRVVLTITAAIAVAMVASTADAQACVGSLPAGSGNTCREQLAVNTASFVGGAFTGSSWDLERNVRNSARAWSQYASARLGYDYVGTTTATACGSGIKHVITGRLGMCTPTPGCDCTQPQHQWTCIGGWNHDCGSGNHLIEINNHPNVVSNSFNPVSPGYPGFLQDTLTHELGHALVDPDLQPVPLGHVPNVSANPDIMRNGGLSASGTSFGPQDISYSGAWVGTAIEYANRWQASTWPHPSLSSWTSNGQLISQWGTLDLTHGYVSGSRRTSFFVADTNQITGIDIDQVNWVPFNGPSGVTRRRPTVVYEPVHQNWWLAGVNPDNTIAVFRSPNRTNWTYLGLVMRPTPSGGSVAATTRFPVALAFESNSQNIVLAYTNFSANWQGTGSFPCGNSSPLCAHELHTVVLPWNATTATVTGTSFTRWQDPNYPAQPSAAVVGAPAVACAAADANNRNCEIIFTAWYSDRAMGFVRFQVSSAGISNRTLPASLGGYTDDDVSYQATYSGALVAAVSGLNSNVWIASKIGVGGSGFGWNQITQYPAGPAIVSKKGPLLRSRMEPYFDLVVFPN